MDGANLQGMQEDGMESMDGDEVWEYLLKLRL